MSKKQEPIYKTPKEGLINPSQQQEQQQEQPAQITLGELLEMIVPVIGEFKEDLAGLSELRSRVELAKVFVWHDQSGNLTFDQTDYEAVWKAITGQNEQETK
jgi:hypothetical protein